MFGLSQFKFFAFLGGGLIIAAFVAWAFRVDHLRAKWKDMAAQEQVAHKQTKDDYRAAQAMAENMHNAEKSRIEGEWKDNAVQTQITLQRRLNGALASLDGMRGKARASVAGVAKQAVYASNASTAADLIGTSAMPVVVAASFTDDDMRICTVNTVKASGWQEFNALQSAAIAVN